MTIVEQRATPVFKSNSLARAQMRGRKQQLSASEQKAILFLISKIKPTDSELKSYTFNISDFCRVCGLSPYNGGARKSIRNVLQDLRNKSVWIRNDNGDDVLCGWLQKVILRKDGLIDVRFDEDMRPFLIELESNFTAFSLKYCLAMTSKYAIRLYEILKSYEFQKKAEFSTEALRGLLGIDDKYPYFGNLRQKVLDPAIREIREFTDLNIELECVREQGRVASVIFTITQKSTEEWAQTWHDIDLILDEGGRKP